MTSPDAHNRGINWGAFICGIRKTLLLFFVIFALFHALGAKSETVKLGTEGAFAPYTFIDTNGVLVGFDIDLGNALCQRAKLDCTWVINDWDTIIDGLISYKYDAILAGMSNTAERRKRVAFSIGYEDGDTTGVYVGRDTFHDPATAVIAVQANTVHAVHLATKGYSVRLYPTARAALDAVINRKADLAFGSPSFLENQIQSPRHSLTVVWREHIDAGPSSIAFRKENSGLRTKFNAALEQMRAEKTLHQLRLKWFGANIDI